MKAIKFPEHTREKLSVINYYYEKWFNIVKNQPTYIIDCFAGIGYNKIKGKIIKGSALLGVDLFKQNAIKKLKLYLIEKNPEKYKQLQENISNYVIRNKINAKINRDIKIIESDWSSVVENILKNIQDGISLFLLDPYGIDSIPWKNILPLTKNGKSSYGYKESGFELLINWPWHAIRRKIGKYLKLKIYGNKLPEQIKKGFETETIKLHEFFDSSEWKGIVKNYPNRIFMDKMTEKIKNVRDELVIAYAIKFFDYFKYVKIHPVYERVKTKSKYYMKRGTVKYFIIFASNYYEALDIIDEKFKEYRNMKLFSLKPVVQKSLSEYFPSKLEKSISNEKEILDMQERIDLLEKELNIELFTINKNIIDFLYKRKNYDYGCFDFALHNEFNISRYHYSINFLITNGIVKTRTRIARSGYIGEYYYLFHPQLVDRGEYLFFEDKIYSFKNGEIVEF